MKQAMPTSPVGPNQEPLITPNVQEASAAQAESTVDDDAPAEGTHELEQLDWNHKPNINLSLIS